jgi:alkanesulfonate monooxygenase SsuD/methylene tetrahydromethanopterin reductase-like flavin-dependent oxidoreductase (luciferase family)
MRATVAWAKPFSWMVAMAASTSCLRLIFAIPSFGMSPSDQD